MATTLPFLRQMPPIAMRMLVHNKTITLGNCASLATMQNGTQSQRQQNDHRHPLHQLIRPQLTISGLPE